MNRSFAIGPKRSLGQNFLTDRNICARIAHSLDLAPQDPVLEVGPGRGALTQILNAHTGPVLALEKDKDLVIWLHQQFPRIGLILGDGLSFCWEATAALPGLTLVGNLPYNVASPMMWDMVSRCRLWKTMVFMVQKEVALRLTAAASTPAYGALSAWMQNFATTKFLFTVPPQVFHPRPKVDSAVVRLTPRPDPALAEASELSRTLKMLFQQRRKQLGTILKKYWHVELEAWCMRQGLDRTARPENLSPDQLRELSRILADANAFSEN